MYKYNPSARNHRGWLLVATLAVAGCAGGGAAPPPSAEEEVTVTERQRVQPVAAEPTARAVPLRTDAPLRYVVKKGDTLWDIAAYFLEDPWYWPELWHANPEIANPHLIYPGDVLELVWVDGRPRVRRVKKLSPQVRRLPLESAVPTIPIDSIRQFLEGPRLVTAEELAAAPYIVQFLDEHLIGGSGVQTYVRRAVPNKGRLYGLVRRGDEYRDPETGELLGYEAIPVGRIEIADFGDVSTGTITRSYREALVGDRLLPLNENILTADFQPRAPAEDIRGYIISVYDGVSEIGQYEVVTLNRGTRDGLEPGHVLDIYKGGGQARDPVTGERLTLPAVKAGTLLVFKVEDRVSFGLVMRATRAIHVMDRVERPE